MLPLYAITLLAALSRPVASASASLAALQPRAPSNDGTTKGHITCVEPSGTEHRLTPQIGQDRLYRHAHADTHPLLEVKLDLGAAARNRTFISLTAPFESTATYSPEDDSWLRYFRSAPKRITYRYLGATSGHVGVDGMIMGPLSGMYGWLTPTGHESTPYRPGREFFTESPGIRYVESEIWTYDPQTGFLTPNWVNGDIAGLRKAHNHTNALHTFFYPDLNTFGFTGNFAKLAQLGDLTGPIHKCDLKFTPLAAGWATFEHQS